MDRGGIGLRSLRYPDYAEQLDRGHGVWRFVAGGEF
jgi:hypothetical protein